MEKDKWKSITKYIPEVLLRHHCLRCYRQPQPCCFNHRHKSNDFFQLTRDVIQGTAKSIRPVTISLRPSLNISEEDDSIKLEVRYREG